MRNRPHLLFVITDGGRARLVHRIGDNGQYVTLEELDGGPALSDLRRELRASAPGRAYSSGSPQRSAVGREDHVRPAREAFVATVAERAAEVCRRRQMDAVVVAAPPRLIGAFRMRIEGKAQVAGAIRKDLAKTPNSELGAWLDDVYFNPQPAR